MDLGLAGNELAPDAATGSALPVRVIVSDEDEEQRVAGRFWSADRQNR
jgi:hypothetical protein